MKFCLIALFFSIGIISTDSALGEEPSEKEIAQLISQLGKVATYEQAVKQLGEIGSAATIQLRTAAEGDNHLISRRAKLVLGNIARRNKGDTLQAFVDGETNQAPFSSWKSYCEIVGDSRESRQLFVDMHRDEPDLLEAYAQDVNGAESLLQTFLANDPQLSQGSLAAVLLVAGDQRIRNSIKGTMHICSSLGTSLLSVMSMYGEAKTPSVDVSHLKNNQSLRKLIRRWILVADKAEGKYAYASLFFPKLLRLLLAVNFELPEGIDLAARVLSEKPFDPTMTQYATFSPMQRNLKTYSVLVIAQLGDKFHAKLLEPLLSNKEQVYEALNLNNREKQFLFCDLALGMLVGMTDQDLSDYNFTKSPKFAEKETCMKRMQAIHFASQESREEGIKKWRAWSKANLTDEPPATAKASVE